MAHATRYNQNKPMIHLVTGKYIRGTAEVMTFGAKKYGENNWRKGLTVSSVIDSAMRHLLKIADGEDIDDESGQEHWKHLSANVMFLSEFLNNPTLDDRYKAPTTETVKEVPVKMFRDEIMASATKIHWNESKLPYDPRSPCFGGVKNDEHLKKDAETQLFQKLRDQQSDNTFFRDIKVS
jgi:hypothetical protein